MDAPQTTPSPAPGPRLPGRVVRRDDPDRVIDVLLAELFIHANNCVRAFGDFHCAVSATPDAEPVLMRLMYDPPYRDFPWKRTRLWMVDELDVVADDPHRRHTRLSDTVVALSGLPEGQFHPLDPAADPGEYVASLREHLGWREKGHDRIDYVLLTLGEHGQLSAVGEAPIQRRITMPKSFINSARLIAVFAPAASSGVIRGLERAASAGCLGLAPVGGELVWYLAEEPTPPTL